MNRTPTPKSFKSGDTRATQLQQEIDPSQQPQQKTRQSDKALLARLDDCSSVELEQLRQRQARINARFTQAETDDLCESWRTARHDRPVGLKDEADKQDPVDPALLFTQFTGEGLLPLVKRQSLLMHNFADLESQRLLYGWPTFQQTLQPFFRPVHYEIYGRQASRPYTPPLNERSLVQNALIHSHFQPDVVRCQDLALALEAMLNAVLCRLLLHDTRLALVLEWNDTKDFWLVVGFRVRYCTEVESQGAKVTLEALKNESLQLCRQDLVDEAVGEMADFETEQQLKLDLGWLRRALRHSTVCYLYCGYVKRV